MHATAPGREETQSALVNALGEALVAEKQRGGAGGERQAASFAGNPFLAAVAAQSVPYQYPPNVRTNLARLLGYLTDDAAVAYLAKALKDLDAREMARCSLESHASEGSTNALIAALDLAGTDFRVGVVNSLAKRKGEPVVAALRKAAADPQPEVRRAALYALAEFPDPANDAVLEAATRSTDAEESQAAHIARARLAETLRRSGNQPEAKRIYTAILAGPAAEPQKKAARLALKTAL